ncbi:hypothetical protein NP493_54g05012 [Ridgeia piscesae]|uniref:Piezo transmembrane helical unit domain-containing protein n=1 Tax=Ridgeia piscesae TaxID=27915 RepID=A0AAD9PAY0_RIDPI|nr:hypothetical protein NP493_54g05012 [Ridgeia piscesae]
MVELRRMQEDEGLNRVKRKMERIKLRQERLHQKEPFDSDDHFVVIRSGDYYMFEDDSDDDDIISSENAFSPEDTKASMETSGEDEHRLGPLQLINMTFKSGTKQTLDVVKRQEDDRAVSPHRRSMEGGGDAPDGAREPEPLEDVEPEQPTENEPLKTRICNGIKVAWKFFGTLIEQLIHVLNGISYRYRKISSILDEEKEEEKKRMNLRPSEGARGAEGPEGVESQPLHHREVTLLVDVEETEAGDQQESEKKFQKKMPLLLRLCLSLFDALMSRSELVCYFVLILNHLVNASLLSLVYPVSVFLWAMLSVPRPDKTYWVVVITYTEAVVLVKYLFQFGFIPWNKETPFSHNPFFPPRIIGIEQKSDFALFDLFVLFCLFIHRSVLKVVLIKACSSSMCAHEGTLLKRVWSS